eukprot:3935942-Rhodomonas_salina.1
MLPSSSSTPSTRPATASMMWIVITSSSWTPYRLVPPRLKYDELPLITSVIRPASIESLLPNDCEGSSSRSEDAMSLRMRRRESSESSPEEPRIRSALTTAQRTVACQTTAQQSRRPRDRSIYRPG